MSKKNRRLVHRQASFVSSKAVEFNPDYTIIKHDLKRIGILAGSFLAFLIVLAIFQNQIMSFFIK